LLARLELVLTQIAELERERDAVVETDASDKVRRAFCIGLVPVCAALQIFRIG
jgi:hypothetical protein